MKTISSFFIALIFSLFIVACGSGESAHSQETTAPETTTEAAAEAPHGEGPEYTSAYVCPMHCEGSGSDQAGVCPVCGMDYVANADHVGDGHSH